MRLADMRYSERQLYAVLLMIEAAACLLKNLAAAVHFWENQL